jgi:hypothetical protein
MQGALQIGNVTEVNEIFPPIFDLMVDRLRPIKLISRRYSTSLG